MSSGQKAPPTLAQVLVQRDAILKLAEQYGAYNLRIFGSVARGEAGSESDLDMVANFHEHSLLDRIALMRELSTLLAIKVDVVQEKALKPHVRVQ